MRINIRVVPKASRALVKDEGQGLKVYLTKPPQDNQANMQLVEILAKHFGVKKSAVNILQGEKSRNKVAEIKL